MLKDISVKIDGKVYYFKDFREYKEFWCNRKAKQFDDYCEKDLKIKGGQKDVKTFK